MPPERTSSGFGGRLRDARERRGVSLRQIASATKISVGVLDALERNDVAKLPGGIFGRAFVRSYAVEVGLDPEATIQDFVTQFPDNAATIGRPSDHQEDHAAVAGNRRSPGVLMWWLLAVSVPIIILVVYLATLRRTGSVEPLRETSAPPAGPVTSIGAAPPAGQPSPGSERPAAAPPPQSAASASTPAGSALRLPVATATSGDRLTVTLAARRPCWVSATVDGQKAIERLLQTGEQQVVTVRRDMVLTAGDASAIVLRFNGVDGRTLGKAGEVVTARFSVSNYKDYLQAP